MSGENLRPKNGERLSDIPRGIFEGSVTKLAEEGLTRKPFERLAVDWQYRKAVVTFMCTGYDASVKEERAAEELERRRKERRRLPGGGFPADEMELFCALATNNPRTFVRVTAWSLAQTLTEKDEGHSPIRQVFCPDKAAKLKEILPVSAGNNRGTKATEIVADALLHSCNEALSHLGKPHGYRDYAKKVRHGGIGIGQIEEVSKNLAELIAVDPVLFLQFIAVDFCRTVTGGRSPKKGLALRELIGQFHHPHIEGCPEIDIGNILQHYLAQALDWKNTQGGYPDPRQYHSLEFCCDMMERLKLKHTNNLTLQGSLGKGLHMTVWKDLNTLDEEVWFPNCPFCEKKLHLPPGVKLYDEKRDRERLKIWR